MLQYSKIFDFPEHFLPYSLPTRLSRSILTAKALSNTLFFRQQLELPQYFNEIFPIFQTHSHSCTREVMQKIISAIDEKITQNIYSLSCSFPVNLPARLHGNYTFSSSSFAGKLTRFANFVEPPATQSQFYVILHFPPNYAVRR